MIVFHVFPFLDRWKMQLKTNTHLKMESRSGLKLEKVLDLQREISIRYEKHVETVQVNHTMICQSPKKHWN